MERDIEEVRQHVRELADSYLEKGDILGWFEALYAESGGDRDHIPWADLEPNRFLVEWDSDVKIPRKEGKALVVGCGLGDDAKYLHERGYSVTGFDISATAIDWAKRIHEGSPMEFLVADLFNPPGEWQEAFDLVLEVYTIQALPLSMRKNSIEAIAGFVAPKGRLIVVEQLKDENRETEGPPWPLTKDEIGQFEELGLSMRSIDEYLGDEDEPVVRFVADLLKG